MSKNKRKFPIQSRTFGKHLDCGDLGEREAEITYSFSPADPSVGQSESVDIEDVLVRFGADNWVAIELDDELRETIREHCDEHIDDVSDEFEKRLNDYFFDGVAA